MFTGIVETIGSESLTCHRETFWLTRSAVAALERQDDSASGGGGTSLTIADADTVLEDAHLGDSISINGTCAAPPARAGRLMPGHRDVPDHHRL